MSELVTNFDLASSEEELLPPNVRHFVAWLIAAGLTDEDIAKELNAESDLIDWLSHLAPVKDEVIRIQKIYFDRTLADQIRRGVPSALKYATELAKGEHDVKPELRWSASQWLMEKASGKPTQEVKASVDINMSHILDIGIKMRQAREAGGRSPVLSDGRVIDVTPVEKTASELWLESNFLEAAE